MTRKEAIKKFRNLFTILAEASSPYSNDYYKKQYVAILGKQRKEYEKIIYKLSKKKGK
jgi:hypothetical protein